MTPLHDDAFVMLATTTGSSPCPHCIQLLSQQAAILESLEAMRKRLETLATRVEVEDARTQNALIRQGAPVHAFKTTSSGGVSGPSPPPTASATPPPLLFSLTPSWLRQPR